jgi:ketosteroid isomerase-like protein
MTSSTLQAFERHSAAVRDRDLDAIVAGYAPDAVLADTNRIGRGHDYIRAVHAETLDAAAALEPSLEVLEDGDVVFVAWHAAPADGPELRGTNTFVITGGLIAVNTAYLTVATAAPTRLDRAAG